MKRVTSVIAIAVSCQVGCSESDPPTTTETGNELARPAPTQGLQLQMLSDLDPAVETERCRFFAVPPGGLYVNRQEVRFTAGSHHALLFATPYTSIPTVDRFGAAVDTSGVFDCGEEGPTAHWEVSGVAGGSQTAHGEPIVGDLPADTAVKLPGGSVLLMNTHYLNATDKTLHTDARINLYTIPAEQAKQEAGFIFFYNPFIRVPAMGNAVASEVCPVLSDISLVNAQNHMHKRGVGYEANLLDSSGSKLEELYKGTEWEEVVMHKNTPPKALKQGQMIQYHCDYTNREDRVITQGLSTKDEMCMFIGLYYPRNRQFELCGLNDTWEGRFLAARWIGNGTKGGMESLGCLMAAKDPKEDKGESFYGCVVDSCPRISTEMSNAVRCLTVNTDQTQCTPMLGALAAAKCE